MSDTDIDGHVFSNTGSPNCEMDASDWVILLFTIVTTSVTWWLFQLPTLFKKGFKYYFHDVSWECVRLYVPAWAVGSALYKQDRKHWVMAYYAGVNRNPTRFDTIKALVIDSMVIVSTVLSVIKICNAELAGQNTSHLGGLNGAVPTYPSLPASVYGLWLSVAARTRLRVWMVIVIGLLIISAIISGIAVSLALTDSSGDSIWVAPTFLAIYMALPFYLIHHKLLLLCMLISILARLGPLIFGATSSPPIQPPFCVVNGWGLAGPVLGLGILGFLLALRGVFLRPRMEADEGREGNEEGVASASASFRPPTKDERDSRFITRMRRLDGW